MFLKTASGLCQVRYSFLMLTMSVVCKCIASNPLEVFDFRSFLEQMRRICREWGHPCRREISIKMHSSNFVGIMLLCEVFPCQFAAYIWAPYYGMASEGLLWFIIDYKCIYKCKYLHKRTWWEDNRLLQVLTNTYITMIKKKLCKIFAKERKEKNLKIHRKTPLSG